ncbi:hypothetical protein M1L60_23820 [Actinoplanes sp. TRM 88003]|uniref:Uncharacterized protein n=1 Tax=Paractinoplanes aksuensis TaxID=2939490 RepID=A0ABT1DS12_9ACTN|nr:hypothetical protein [Actinoplanes aksuensis]MCO8273627.1 hypothetical protein [Actinoplanes aksuensis]
MATRSLPLLLVALTVVAGCSTSGDDGGANPVPSGVSGAGDSPAPPGPARTIPASAFLKMPDTMQRERQKADGATAVPQLCDRELAPGDGVLASAAMMSHYQAPDAPEGSVPNGVLYLARPAG